MWFTDKFYLLCRSLSRKELYQLKIYYLTSTFYCAIKDTIGGTKMYTIPNTLSVTELRRKSAAILKDLPREKLLLLLQNSKPKGALVDLEYLKMLQKTYEDYLDIIAFDKAISEPTISWKEYKKKSLKKK